MTCAVIGDTFCPLVFAKGAVEVDAWVCAGHIFTTSGNNDDDNGSATEILGSNFALRSSVCLTDLLFPLEVSNCFAALTTDGTGGHEVYHAPI